MELSQLRAMQALAELRSFTLAAQRLHLSPPAVFSQIKQLEARLGGRLYEKSGRTLVLTPKGKLLAEHANRIVSAHDLAFEEITGGATSRREVLRLGAGPCGAVRIVPHLLRAYLGAHPGVEARLAAGEEQDLLRQVHAGTLDAVLLTLPTGDLSLEEYPLWSYDLVFVLPPRDYKEWHSSPELRRLADKPFILYRRPVMVEQSVRRLCLAAGFAPHVTMESDNPAAIAELVKLGLGYAVLPMWTVGEDLARRELSLPGAELSATHQYGLICRPGYLGTRAGVGLRKVAAEWFAWWPLARFVQPREALRNAG